MKFSIILAAIASTAFAIVLPGGPDGICPESQDNANSTTTFLPDKNDCNTFYICVRSGTAKFNCPPGLDFSPKYLICDFPTSAGCLHTGEGYNATTTAV